MHRQATPPPPRQPHALTLAARTWLACGCVLLGLTPLPARDGTWGWSPLFWLLLAPAILLLARRLLVQAATPLRLATMRRSNSRMMR